MDKKALKLAIIQQIVSCEDERVLIALQNTLANVVSAQNTGNDDLIAALLQDKPNHTETTSDQEVADLQKSINDIFE